MDGTRWADRAAIPGPQRAFRLPRPGCGARQRPPWGRGAAIRATASLGGPDRGDALPTGPFQDAAGGVEDPLHGGSCSIEIGPGEFLGNLDDASAVHAEVRCVDDPRVVERSPTRSVANWLFAPRTPGEPPLRPNPPRGPR